MSLSTEDIYAIARETARIHGEQLLRDVEVAALLGLGKSTVWELSKDGTIPRPVKIGNNTRWKRSQILNYIDGLEVAA